MLKPMPYKMIKFYSNMSNIKLNDFFGFCLAEITTPKNILKPLLPYKHNGKTIFPTGTWIGVYFSEELKAVLKHGYQINLIKGYEFSKIDLFSNYVNYFYDLKRNATGAARWIAKNHLNLLYGIFGRRKDLIQTMNVYNKDLPKYIATKIVKTIIEINEEICTILIQNNINADIINSLNSYFESDITNSYSEVPSNVAIAAAVTAYARIHMIPFRLHPGTVYTDTDSIFSNEPLPIELLGCGIGLMKDELNGSVINEAYFLGIKQYGYWYMDSNNQRIEQSVFAGITRNSLKFEEIVKLFNGLTLYKFVENRFYKSFKNLSISIKSVNVSIKMNSDKKLINNNFIPLNIFNLNHCLDNRSFYLKLRNKLIRLFKHYLNRD
jgi:DNA polymerase family B